MLALSFFAFHDLTQDFSLAMTVALITGSTGLVGSEAAVYFAGLGMHVVGVDNDMRRVFFGEQASTKLTRERLSRQLRSQYSHHNEDIRDLDAMRLIAKRYGNDIQLVLHAAAQPSHDWAAQDPITDFDINARGTLHLLEAVREYAPDSTFIFVSTNKVYGDAPNRLPLIEQNQRWEIDSDHSYANGIREDMSIDQSQHSIFGVSKAAADLMVQEYGRYFGMKTACFRGGCLTGPNHAGAQLHGFLAYLMKCTTTGQPYTVFGYKGKQVRDNIHSADLVKAFHAFYEQPRVGQVYNIGGGRTNNCSMLEAIEICQDIAGRELDWTYSEDHRLGDHIWWISDNGKFEGHYPDWKQDFSLRAILADIYAANVERWTKEAAQA